LLGTIDRSAITANGSVLINKLDQKTIDNCAYFGRGNILGNSKNFFSKKVYSKRKFIDKSNR
jgi:hypothetical protein